MKMTRLIEKALVDAKNTAKRHKHNEISPGHVLSAIIGVRGEQESGTAFLNEYGFKVDILRTLLADMPQSAEVPQSIEMSKATSKLFDLAEAYVTFTCGKSIDCAMLLMAMFCKPDPIVAEAFLSSGMGLATSPYFLVNRYLAPLGSLICRNDPERCRQLNLLVGMIRNANELTMRQEINDLREQLAMKEPRNLQRTIGRATRGK